jgi:hypothetical protein
LTPVRAWVEASGRPLRLPWSSTMAGEERGVLDEEGWAELRREHFVRGVSIKELARRTGMSRNTIRAAVAGVGGAEVPAAGGAVEA